jgi:hypothetical protein
MILAEIYARDSEEFLGIIMANDKHHLDGLLDIIKFEIDVDVEAVNYGERMVLQ